jgi:hypothetical protein
VDDSDVSGHVNNGTYNAVICNPITAYHTRTYYAIQCPLIGALTCVHKSADGDQSKAVTQPLSPPTASASPVDGEPRVQASTAPPSGAGIAGAGAD